MSKFKPGDTARYVGPGYTNTDTWRYRVILTGLIHNEGQPAVLVEYIQTHPDRKMFLGRHWLCPEKDLVKVPKIHKVTLVTYSPFSDSDAFTSYVDPSFTTPEAWKKEWPLHALRDYRIIEIELPE